MNHRQVPHRPSRGRLSVSNPRPCYPHDRETNTGTGEESRLLFLQKYSSLCEAGVAFPSHATLTTNTMITAQKRTGRPTATDPLSFKSTTKKNIRFEKMLSEAGREHNRNRFIVKRIFSERFEVIERDLSKYSLPLV